MGVGGPTARAQFNGNLHRVAGISSIREEMIYVE